MPLPELRTSLRLFRRFFPETGISARRTGEQASSLEDVSAAIGESTALIRQNADNAQKSHEAAIQASGVAESGGKIVHDAVYSINEVSKAGRKTVGIMVLSMK